VHDQPVLSVGDSSVCGELDDRRGKDMAGVVSVARGSYEQFVLDRCGGSLRPLAERK
jgi:hypothetical protein